MLYNGCLKRHTQKASHARLVRDLKGTHLIHKTHLTHYRDTHTAVQLHFRYCN